VRANRPILPYYLVNGVEVQLEAKGYVLKVFIDIEGAVLIAFLINLLKKQTRDSGRTRKLDTGC